MSVTVTLQFADAAAASTALARLAGVIDPADRPDAGAPVVAVAPASAPPKPATDLAAVGFGQGVTLPPGATPALPTAAVAQVPTAPVAPISTPAPVPPAPAAPTAPVADAPAAPAAPSTAAPSADSRGLPWDARIHTSTKATNADGTWRTKRGTDPTVLASVEAELRQLAALNAAAVPSTPSAVVASVPPAPSVPAAPVPLPPAPETAQAPSAAPTDAAVTFEALMERMSPAMVAGKLTVAQITEVLKRHGLSGLGQLTMAPNLLPAVAADLEPLLAAAGA